MGIGVESGDLSAVFEDRIRVYESEEAKRFLSTLPAVIQSTLRDQEQALPRNPHLASEFQAKIALLSRPDLEETIPNDTLVDLRERKTERLLQ